MSGGEFELIDWIATRSATRAPVLVGIGDDAAVLEPAASSQLVTTDMLMDGVDFLSAELPALVIGRKALAVSLSDIAAMGGRAVTAFCAVAVPKSAGQQYARELHEGLLALADEFEVVLAGGDTNSWDGPLVITTTVLGEPLAGQPVLRSGARPGDVLCVTGALGGSLRGHHYSFQPRLKEVQLLLELARPTSMIDLSDGLAADVRHLCDGSGVGVRIDSTKVPLTPAAHEASQTGSGRTPLEHALGDGEDFELLFTLDPNDLERVQAAWKHATSITPIGVMTAELELLLIDAQGQPSQLPELGWKHHLAE